MNISVLGCGRWGTFISWYLSNHKHQVIQWGRESSASFNQLLNYRKNDYVELNEDVFLTCDLEKAISSSSVIIISINSQNLRDLLSKVVKYPIDNKIFILCMKGVEVDTGKRLTEVAVDCGIDINNLAIWVGPGHIQAFTQGLPNCMLIDSRNKNLTKKIADAFRSDLIRFYYGDDLIGSEIGAAAKNVMGIAAGMLDGGGYSTLKGALMARGAREVSRLIKTMGGNELSAYGLCHLGDYEATVFSKYSHNRMFGEKFILGEKYEHLAEGYYTVKALMTLSERYDVELPICKAVYDILYLNKEPKETLSKLFSREKKSEF